MFIATKSTDSTTVTAGLAIVRECVLPELPAGSKVVEWSRKGRGLDSVAIEFTDGITLNIGWAAGADISEYDTPAFNTSWLDEESDLYYSPDGKTRSISPLVQTEQSINDIVGAIFVRFYPEFA